MRAFRPGLFSMIFLIRRCMLRPFILPAAKPAQSTRVFLRAVLKGVFMSRITDLGIDLGTSNVLIYGRNRGIIFKAPAVIALNRDTNAVIAIGEDAHKMLGRAPGSIIVKRPLKGGIAGKNLALVGAMLLHFVIEANGKHIFQGPRVIMSVPPALNETERRAITASLFESGARRTQIISRPIAAALGADLPIGETYGEMIVDIGGSITDIAVISMGACVINESLPIGGDSFDEAIIRYVRRKHNLLIGEITAEEIKTRIGSVMPRRDPLYLDITGRDLLSGLPKTLRITSDEVLEALDDPLQELIEVIHSVLERTPAELAADIFDTGIVFSGGGALLEGLSDAVSIALKINCRIADSPQECIARGCGLTMEKFNEYSRYLVSSRKKNRGVQ